MLDQVIISKVKQVSFQHRLKNCQWRSSKYCSRNSGVI